MIQVPTSGYSVVNDPTYRDPRRTMIATSGQQRSAADSSYAQRSHSRNERPVETRHRATSSVTDPSPSSSHSRPYDQADFERTARRSAREASPSYHASASTYNRSRASSSGRRGEPGRSGSPPMRYEGSSPPASQNAFSRSARSLDDVRSEGTVVKVRDLAHIQSFANEDFLSPRGRPGQDRDASEHDVKYEISGMPITEIIEMVAGLLTKIMTTNDRQHENLHRPGSAAESVATTGMSSSVLAFHGRNVPSITILSYLSRIHKYCPTTYEVFLSLLVYFDRMTERVNASSMQAARRSSLTDDDMSSPDAYSADGSDLADSPSSRSAPESAEDLERAYTHGHPPTPSALPLSHFFVVDSFNIHRLVISGVTCASKFFSDVFYTNSRYAKVGGLPLAELNHLELQFLLLNDFRLSVPVEELEAYGTMLVEFYAREVAAQRQHSMAMPSDMAYRDHVPMSSSASP